MSCYVLVPPATLVPQSEQRMDHHGRASLTDEYTDEIRRGLCRSALLRPSSLLKNYPKGGIIKTKIGLSTKYQYCSEERMLLKVKLVSTGCNI